MQPSELRDFCPIHFGTDVPCGRWCWAARVEFSRLARALHRYWCEPDVIRRLDVERRKLRAERAVA